MPDKKAKTICLAQSKGGTSKTSSVVNIAAALVRQGHGPVLTIDLDQQASLTISLGVNPVGLIHSMRHLLVDPSVTAQDILVPTREEGVDLLPANVDLAMIEFAMPPMSRERVLARKLAVLLERYKYVLIDTPPSFSITTLNGLSAADYVLLPVQPEPLCLLGLAQHQQVLEQVQADTNPGLKLLGLFVAMYDARKGIHREIAEKLRQDWGGLLFKTMVRERSNLIDTSLEGRSIVSVSPRSDVAKDYQALTQEIINRVN